MSPAVIFIVCVAGIFGLVIGSFLNVVAYRVPERISLLRESRCPHCGATVQWYQNVPVLSWLLLRGRCAGCRWPIPVSYPLVEAVTGGLFAVVAWFLVTTTALPTPALMAVLAAFCWFAAVSVVLVVIDLRVRRLPDAIVLPSYLVGGGLLTLACLFGADWADLLRAALGMAILYGGYALLRWLRPDGMGAGDVKLAGTIGIFLGWLGWGPLAVGALAAFLLGGTFGVVLLATGRARRGTAIPFGPWMILGAWLGILAGAELGRLYGSLYGLS